MPGLPGVVVLTVVQLGPGLVIPLLLPMEGGTALGRCRPVGRSVRGDSVYLVSVRGGGAYLVSVRVGRGLLCI